MNNLSTSFATRINELHAEGREIDGTLRFSILRKLNVTRECGLVIEDAKNVLNQSQWKELQGELDLGEEPERVIQTYLTFARKHPDAITDINEGLRAITGAVMATGLLPFTEGHGDQKLHGVNVFSWTAKAAMSFRSELKKRIASTPIETWTEEAREQFVVTVRPIADDLVALIAMAQTPA